MPDTPSARAALEDCLLAFIRALNEGTDPRLESFLPEGTGRQEALVELVHAELEFRLKRGESVCVAEYLDRFPELSANPEVIQGLADAEERFRQMEVPATTPGEWAPTPGDHQPSNLPGFEVIGLLGQGGMGVVYKARDCSFDRAVALKYLKPEYAGDPGASKRFLYESQITARLQHPGIPPVHQVGILSDGRPFLAMKLIQGETLDHLLREQGPGAAKWLPVFEAICQAVGYAHSQNIIHRDLKPGNVMVGAFGEVQVMDWGLAKVLPNAKASAADRETDREATTPPTSGQAPWALRLAGERASQDDDMVTRAGTVLGTPAYMPPEQAIGAVDRLDRRSDVFGLGAILCALLTGKPPFVANDAESTRQLAAQAKLDDAFARLDQCEAEPGLIALAKRCLAADPDERPADGGKLAAEVAALRRQAEERARQAEMEKSRAEVQVAEQRKRRRVVTLAGGALLAVLLAGIVGTTFGLIQAEAKRKEAEKARDLARGRYLLALDAFNQIVFGIQSKLENRPGTQDLRKDLLENARKGLRKLLEEAERQGTPDRTLVWAHLRMGDVEMVVGNTEAARREYQAGHDLAQRLGSDDPRNAEAQRDLCISYEKLGDVTLRLGQTKDALDFYQKSLDGLLRLAKDDPRNATAQRDLSVSYNKLGDVTLQLRQTNEALDYFQKSSDIFQRLASDDPRNAEAQRNLSVSYDRLGNVMLRLGQTRKALDFYQKSLSIALRLAKDDTNNAQAQGNLSSSYEKLGDVTLRLGQTKQALDFYRKSLGIALRLAKDDHKNAQAQRGLSFSYEKLGDVTLRLGQTKQALDFYQKSLEIRLTLAKDDHKNAQAQRDVSVSYNKLGDVTLQLGHTKEALDYFQKSLDVRLTLAKDDSKNAQAQRDLFVSYDKLGDVTRRLGQTGKALDFFKKSRDIALRLANDSKNSQAQRDLSISYDKLGDVTLQLGQTEVALDFYRKNLAIALRLAKDDNAEAQRDLAISYNKLGDATLRLGQTRQALDFYLKSLGIALRLANDSKNAQAQRDLFICYDKLGDVTLQLRRTKEAFDFYQKSLSVSLRLAKDDNNAQAQMALFVSYWKLGDFEQGQHQYSKAGDWFAKGRAVLMPLQQKKLLVGQQAGLFGLVERQIALCKTAEKAVISIDFVFEQKPETIADLLDLRVRALLHHKKTADATATAERWTEWAEKQDKIRDSNRYNAACALALCAAASDDKQKDALAEKCVAVLTKLRDADYFKDDKRLAHFHKDTDFAGLRQHPAFVKFTKTLAKE